MLLFILACTPDDAAPPDENTGDVATTMPYHGGCTEVRTSTVRGEDAPYYTIETVYDDAEREVEETITYDGIERVERWTYDDAGCLTVDEVTSSEGGGYGFTQTCDDHLNPLHHEGTYNDVAYSFDAEWTYVGDLPTYVVYDNVNDRGDTWTTANAYTWDDGLLVRDVESLNGVESAVETWTYEDGLVVTYVRGDPSDPAATWTWTYDHDAYGRLTSEEVAVAGYDTYESWSTSWFDAIFHTASETETTGQPGYDDDGWSTTVWDCSGAFPWACTAPYQGVYPNSSDAEFDVLLGETWECPA